MLDASAQTPTVYGDVISAVLNPRSYAMSILPTFTVSGQGLSRIIRKLSPDALLSVDNSVIPPSGIAQEVDWGLEEGIRFEWIERGQRIQLTEQLRDNADQLDLSDIARRICTARVYKSIDLEFGTFLNNASNITGGSQAAANWSTTSANIQTQIKDAKLAVQLATEQTPDTLIVGPTTYKSLPGWLSVGGDVSAIEQVRNEIAVDRIFEFGAVRWTPGNTEVNGRFEVGIAVSVSGGTGSGATIDAITVNADGQITGITWDNHGTGYATGDELTFMQRHVFAKYTLVAADHTSGVLDDLTGKTIQGRTNEITPVQNFLWDGNAILASTQPPQDSGGTFVSAFAGFFVDDSMNFMYREYEHPVGSGVMWGEVRTRTAIVSLEPNAAYQFLAVNS